MEMNHWKRRSCEDVHSILEEKGFQRVMFKARSALSFIQKDPGAGHLHRSSQSHGIWQMTPLQSYTAC